MLSILFFAACASPRPAPDPIRPDEDSCAFCRMQVSQPKFAAEILKPEGEHVKFDDIGCFRNYIHADASLERAPMWVIDYQTGRWLEARSAFFALNIKESTPMGSGVVALATAERARALSDQTATFAELMAGGKR